MSTKDVSMDELANAWREYQRLGAEGRDWEAWSALFTDDATYVEHVLGRFHGAEEIRDFIFEAMDPVRPMTFSVDWAILQPPNVAFNIWNHMPDPAGQGTLYSFSNLSLITYAGDGKWSWEEDFYAPNDPGKVVGRWFKAGGTNDMPPDPSIQHVSLVEAPTTDDPEGVDAMVQAWRSGTPLYTDDAEVWEHGIGRIPAADAAAFATPADLVVSDGKRAFLRCGNAGIALIHGGAGRIRWEERARNPTELDPA